MPSLLSMSNILSFNELVERNIWYFPVWWFQCFNGKCQSVDKYVFFRLDQILPLSKLFVSFNTQPEYLFANYGINIRYLFQTVCEATISLRQGICQPRKCNVLKGCNNVKDYAIKHLFEPIDLFELGRGIIQIQNLVFCMDVNILFSFALWIISWALLYLCKIKKRNVHVFHADICFYFIERTENLFK